MSNYTSVIKSIYPCTEQKIQKPYKKMMRQKKEEKKNQFLCHCMFQNSGGNASCFNCHNFLPFAMVYLV